MSDEQLKAFIEKVQLDDQLQEILKTVSSIEEVVGLAREAGFVITPEDIQSRQFELYELSDEELERTSGGCQYSFCVAATRQAARVSFTLVFPCWNCLFNH